MKSILTPEGKFPKVDSKNTSILLAKMNSYPQADFFHKIERLLFELHAYSEFFTEYQRMLMRPLCERIKSKSMTWHDLLCSRDFIGRNGPYYYEVTSKWNGPRPSLDRLYHWDRHPIHLDILAVCKSMVSNWNRNTQPCKGMHCYVRIESGEPCDERVDPDSCFCAKHVHMPENPHQVCVWLDDGLSANSKQMLCTNPIDSDSGTQVLCAKHRIGAPGNLFNSIMSNLFWAAKSVGEAQDCVMTLMHSKCVLEPTLTPGDKLPAIFKRERRFIKDPTSNRPKYRLLHATPTTPEDALHSDQCGICLNTWNDQKVVKLRSCQHEFHYECLALWFQTWKTRRTGMVYFNCPYCRSTKIAYCKQGNTAPSLYCDITFTRNGEIALERWRKDSLWWLEMGFKLEGQEENNTTKLDSDEPELRANNTATQQQELDAGERHENSGYNQDSEVNDGHRRVRGWFNLGPALPDFSRLGNVAMNGWQSIRWSTHGDNAVLVVRTEERQEHQDLD